MKRRTPEELDAAKERANECFWKGVGEENEEAVINMHEQDRGFMEMIGALVAKKIRQDEVEAARPYNGGYVARALARVET